jgi:hypothetical protein
VGRTGSVSVSVSSFWWAVLKPRLVLLESFMCVYLTTLTSRKVR